MNGPVLQKHFSSNHVQSVLPAPARSPDPDPPIHPRGSVTSRFPTPPPPAAVTRHRDPLSRRAHRGNHRLLLGASGRVGVGFTPRYGRLCRCFRPGLCCSGPGVQPSSLAPLGTPPVRQRRHAGERLRRLRALGLSQRKIGRAGPYLCGGGACDPQR